MSEENFLDLLYPADGQAVRCPVPARGSRSGQRYNIHLKGSRFPIRLDVSFEEAMNELKKHPPEDAWAVFV